MLIRKDNDEIIIKVVTSEKVNDAFLLVSLEKLMRYIVANKFFYMAIYLNTSLFF